MWFHLFSFLSQKPVSRASVGARVCVTPFLRPRRRPSVVSLRARGLAQSIFRARIFFDALS